MDLGRRCQPRRHHRRDPRPRGQRRRILHHDRSNDRGRIRDVRRRRLPVRAGDIARDGGDRGYGDDGLDGGGAGRGVHSAR